MEHGGAPPSGSVGGARDHLAIGDDSRLFHPDKGAKIYDANPRGAHFRYGAGVRRFDGVSLGGGTAVAIRLARRLRHFGRHDPL